jgi:1-acyl-sn-glycerol-3-phosphate acyltransferase
MAYPFLRQTLISLLARRIRVTGWENLPTSGGFLLIANHQSFLDPPTVVFPIIPRLNRRIYSLTKEPIWKGFEKILGKRGVDWLGMVRVYDKSKADSLRDVKALLQRGEIVCIFPEGTRNREKPGEMLQGKTGAARVALATGVPVIPLGIVAPEGRTTGQSIRNFLNPRLPAELHIGPALHVDKVPEEQFTHELLEATTRRFMQAIGALAGRSYPY